MWLVNFLFLKVVVILIMQTNMFDISRMVYWQSFSFIHFVTTLWKMEGPTCFCVVHAAVAFSWEEREGDRVET